MQLIFVVETTKQANIDVLYLKTTLDKFYPKTMFQRRWVYVKQKSLLTKQDRIIKNETREYKGASTVILCVDYDRANDPENDRVIKYCAINKHKLVWMNLDIEDVFLNRRLSNSKEKIKEANNFNRYKDKFDFGKLNLRENNPISVRHSSNLLNVIDEILDTK